VLNWEPNTHALGVTDMDVTHEEFVRLANELACSSDDDFPYLFNMLLEHTQHHFENEGRLMRACRFPAIGEHESEHLRVLGELRYMRRALDEGRIRFVRLYVSQGMFEWFANHLATMDAALAASIKRAAAPADATAHA
jgi:hemerythrin-like metal-binding protein